MPNEDLNTQIAAIEASRAGARNPAAVAAIEAALNELRAQQKETPPAGLSEPSLGAGPKKSKPPGEWCIPITTIWSREMNDRAEKYRLVSFIPAKPWEDEKDRHGVDIFNDLTEKPWKQIQPPAELIAQCAKDLILECTTIVIEGLGVYRVTRDRIAEPVSEERFLADIAEACKSLMGSLEPTPSTVKTAAEVVRLKPAPAVDIKPTRWEREVDGTGKPVLALHELPLPKEGDWSAFREFTDRCSCVPTLMRWIWTCFLPEEQTGREALVLHGGGNDGKSEFVRSLLEFMGPAAGVSEIIGADDKFALPLIVGKRVISCGDVRNPRPFHGRIMRELLAGATLSYQRKGVDLQQARFHPRIVVTTNEEFRIDPNNAAEFSRVRRVNVAPLDGNMGDRGWTARLAEQWPAFLFECRAEYERSCTPGRDIPITDACRAALSGGVEAIAEEHDYLSARLEFTVQENYVVASVITDLLKKGDYKGWSKTDAYKWLKSNGVKLAWVERKGVRYRVWRGLKIIEEPVFSTGSGSSPVPPTHLVSVGN